MNYFRCPYCSVDMMGQHGKKVNRNVGLFRVKEIEANILVMECQKCLKVFRVRFMGQPLLWADMTPKERKVFRKRTWVMYNGQTSFETIKG